MTFKPGQSGNPKGRPPGSKNKIAEDFLKALAADFEANGEQVIENVRLNKPDAYLKIVADLVPKEMNLDVRTNPLQSLLDTIDGRARNIPADRG